MDKLLVTVSQTAVTQAERAIEACHRCSDRAEVSFSRVLHSFRRHYREDEVEYLLPVLAQCPTCSGDIDEKTIVQVKQKPSAAPGSPSLER
jgi:hypothetical protein